jgi:small-conductance mechanosensitive channel
VERVLLDAAKKVHRVLDNPEPYVFIKEFGSFAVEYILYVFTNDVKRIPMIDSELHKAVLVTCIENNLDLSTPYIIQQVLKN